MVYNTKRQSWKRHLCRKPLAKSPLLALPKNFKPISVQSRIAISRIRCKVGLQSGGTWFSSGTCPRQIGSSGRYRQLCMNRFLTALQRIELRSTDERENHLAFTNHRMTQPAMSVETDRAAWKAGAFLTATRTSHGKSEDPTGSLVG